MNTIINDIHIDALDKVRQFLNGLDETELTLPGKRQLYDFIKRSLIRFKYGYLGPQNKGLTMS